MLILTRRLDEIVVVGEGAQKVEVKILGIQGNQVRMGFNAPRDISVHR